MLERLQRPWGQTNMNWKRVLLLAVGAGLLSGLLGQIPALQGTSLQNLRLSYEFWILLGVFLAVNCATHLEAGLKCMALFLVGRPLMYLVSMLTLGADAWPSWQFLLLIPLLSLPGGMLLHMIPSQTTLSATVLGFLGCLLGYWGVYYFHEATMHFPWQLLSALFCLALPVFLAATLLKKAKLRVIALAITGVAIAVSIYGTFLTRPQSVGAYFLDSGHTWSCTLQDSALGEVSVEDGMVTITSSAEGQTILTCTNELGETVELLVTVDPAAGTVRCTPVTP